MIKDVYQNIGGVDKYDHMLKTYFNERKNRKWTNKLAGYLINMMVHNSYIMYREFSKESHNINKHLTFRREIIKNLATPQK
jgi:hypothetical protein